MRINTIPPIGPFFYFDENHERFTGDVFILFIEFR